MRGIGAYAIAAAIALSILCCANFALASGTTSPSSGNTPTIGTAPVGNDLSLIDIGGFLRLLGGYFRIGTTGFTSEGSPVISAISSGSPQTATTTITWTTNEAANSEVIYGLTTGYGSTTNDASFVTSHSVTLTGLTGGTTYHFAVVSADPEGDTSTSTDQIFVSSTTPYIASSGWTVFSPSPGTGSCSSGTYTGTCIVYVSASAGNDTTCAPVAPPVNESGVTPCATIAKAETLMRNNMPDWMLLKRGDTWVGQSFSAFQRSLNGRSPQEPALISSYGMSGGSPLIEVNGAYDSNDSSEGIATYGSQPAADDLALVGLDFYAYTRDPGSPNFATSTLGDDTTGFDFLAPTDWLLIEGNTFDYFANNVVEAGGDFALNGVTIRRNVIENDYSEDGSHSQGVFTYETTNLVIEDNVFDHNGWNSTLITPASVTISVASPAAVTWSGNYLHNNAAIEFSSTGALPTGLASSTVYCVMNLSGSTFNVYNDGGNCAGGGTAINTSGSQSGTQYGIWEDPQPTIFNRTAYLSTGDGNTVYSNNIDAEGSSGGVQQREGGTTDNNLFLQDPIGIVYGSDQAIPGQPIGGQVEDNVFLNAEDIGTPADSDYQPQGTGITITSTLSSNDGTSTGPALISGLTVSNNILAHQENGTENIVGIALTGTGAFSNTSITNNVIYDWANGLAGRNSYGFYFSLASSTTGTSFSDNAVQMPNGGTVGQFDGLSGGLLALSDNQYYSTNPDPPSGGIGWFGDDETGAISTSTWISETGDTGSTFGQVSYTNPNCTIGTYDSSVLGGPGTFADFMAQADQQNYEDWNPNLTPEVVNAYFRNCY